MKTLWTVLLLMCFATTTQAQRVENADFDTTTVRVGERQAVQVESLELYIKVSFAPGDTLHANPSYNGRAQYTLYAADSTVVVTSRPIDLISHPAIRNADKQRGRSFADELTSLLITLKGLQEE